MDFNYNGMAWITDIHQRFETLCLEVDGVMHEETFEQVENQLQTVGAKIENQLQTMGATIKRLCSEFVHDVLPAFSPDSVEGAALELSPQQNKNIVPAAHESSMVGVDIDPKKELCNKNSLAHPSFMGTEGEDIDSLSKQKADIGMCEKLNVCAMKNALQKPFSTEIPVVVDTAEEDSSRASLYCGVNKFDDEGSHEEYNSYVKEGQIANLVNATADNSNALSSANSGVLDESCQCRVSDTLTTSGDAFSAGSNDISATFVTASVTDSCWVGFEPSSEVAASDYVSVADSVTEGSDDVGAGRSTDGHAIELGMETTQCSELKLDESCVVVDSNPLCSVCLRAAKIQSCKKKTCEACAKKMKSDKEWQCEQKAPWNEDLDMGLNQQKRESLVPSAFTRTSGTVDHDFCDSDWEII